MILTELQRFRIHEAMRHASEVLRDVRRKPRKGKELEELKQLGAAVDNLECFNLTVRTKTAKPA